MNKQFLFKPISLDLRRIRSLISQRVFKRSFGLRAKITFLILLNVAGVLFLFSYLDFHLSKKAHIDLFLDRDLYIAKQIEVGIPTDVMSNLTSIKAELEDWLLSRPTLMKIDVYLFATGDGPIISISQSDSSGAALKLSNGQIRLLKKDKNISSVHETKDEGWLEVMVPLHAEKSTIGGVRVVSSLEEAEGYLTKKRDQAVILTFASILIILITVTLLFGKMVGSPIQKIVEAMSKAEKGDLEANADIRSRDELGELGGHFNRMLKTIREAHKQNVKLLSRVNQFNEELTRRIEAATSELAKRNEDLRLLNEALFESQRQLSQSEKLAALGQVTATIAHQIGTPLNSISGYIQLMLQEGYLRPMDQDRLQIIETQLDRLADSVKNLLSFTPQPKPQFKSLEINSILVELIKLGEPWLHTRNVKLSSSLAPELPPVLGDPTHLQTLFLNLIANALDAMPNGGQLTIETHGIAPQPASENGGWLEITITDTGIGITAEAKKLIFDPFFTTKKIGEGTGLGLAICEKIVREHFGRLEVESEVGKGTTFFVFIPMVPGNKTNE
jgi:two-component system NtrC family sensor kinase